MDPVTNSLFKTLQGLTRWLRAKAQVLQWSVKTLLDRTLSSLSYLLSLKLFPLFHNGLLLIPQTSPDPPPPHYSVWWKSIPSHPGQWLCQRQDSSPSLSDSKSNFNHYALPPGKITLLQVSFTRHLTSVLTQRFLMKYLS